MRARFLGCHLPVFCLSLLLASLACGERKKPTLHADSALGDGTVSLTGAAIIGQGPVPTSSSPVNPNGVPTDGNSGSLDPHPAACGTCASASVSQVAGCASTIGTPIACEGFCFVDPSVAPRWNHEPPSSGPAYPTYEYAGGTTGDPNNNFHTTAEPLPRGNYVHNLAHGFVVIVYNCPFGCDAQIAQIRSSVFVNHVGSGLIVTPDTRLAIAGAAANGPQFAALSWTWAYTFSTVDTAALDCFIRQHQGHVDCDHLPKATSCTGS